MMHPKDLIKICRAYSPTDKRNWSEADYLVEQLCNALEAQVFETSKNKSLLISQVFATDYQRSKFAEAWDTNQDLNEKLEVARKALSFYLPENSYVSGAEEYMRPTNVDAGRGERMINRVGPYGTIAKETLEKLNVMDN